MLSKEEDEEKKKLVLKVEEVKKMFEKEYELKKSIGDKGQFGDVYECKKKNSDNNNNDKYAVKIINKHKYKCDKLSKLFIQMIKKEIKIMKYLKGHNHIIEIENEYENNQFIYIVMEICEEGTLHDYIMKHGTSSEHEVANIMKQSFNTIHDLHKKYNIIHGDISLNNIMFKYNENKQIIIKFIDFGMAEILKYNQNTFLPYKPCGTAYYRAPEIVNHCPYNHAIDLWSIGIVMFMLLYGYSPFHVDSNCDCKNEQEELKILDAKISLGFYPKTVFTETHGYGPWHPSNYEISNEAKNLINHLLITNPLYRLTANQCLHHIWIIKNTNPAKS